MDDFVCLVDFVILDYEQDKHYPLILGRPFLITSKTVIDVYEGNITLRVGEEKVDFVMNRLLRDIESKDSERKGKIENEEIKEASLNLKK